MWIISMYSLCFEKMNFASSGLFSKRCAIEKMKEKAEDLAC